MLSRYDKKRSPSSVSQAQTKNMLAIPISFVVLPTDPCMKTSRKIFKGIISKRYSVYHTTQTNSNREKSSTLLCRSTRNPSYYSLFCLKMVLIIVAAAASSKHWQTYSPNNSHVSVSSAGLTSPAKPKRRVKCDVTSRHRESRKSCQNSAHRRILGIKSCSDVFGLPAVVSQ